MKSIRQVAILDIISKQDIETQEELADALGRMNITVTQATVSRDIKELRLIKVLSPATRLYKYAVSDKPENGLSEKMIRMFSESVLSVAYANNMIVIRTLPGSANVAAETLDSLRWVEILGTLAGDNTIFVVVRSNDEVTHVLARINEMLSK